MFAKGSDVEAFAKAAKVIDRAILFRYTSITPRWSQMWIPQRRYVPAGDSTEISIGTQGVSVNAFAAAARC